MRRQRSREAGRHVPVRRLTTTSPTRRPSGGRSTRSRRCRRSISPAAYTAQAALTKTGCPANLFDNDTTMNNSDARDITTIMFGSTDYDCHVGTNEIKWNHTTQQLLANGIFYFDGTLTSPSPRSTSSTAESASFYFTGGVTWTTGTLCGISGCGLNWDTTTERALRRCRLRIRPVDRLRQHQQRQHRRPVRRLRDWRHTSSAATRGTWRHASSTSSSSRAGRTPSCRSRTSRPARRHRRRRSRTRERRRPAGRASAIAGSRPRRRHAGCDPVPTSSASTAATDARPLQPQRAR